MPNLFLLNDDQLPADIRSLVASLPLPALDADETDTQILQQLDELLNVHGLSHNLVGAGLWLTVGELDRSHSISQHDDTSTGAFWHGIMHRREGDFGNAKYWFRRAAGHPAFSSLAAEISQHDQIEGFANDLLTDAENLAVNLVDLVAANVVDTSSPAHASLREVCWWEWQLLMTVTCRQEGAC